MGKNRTKLERLEREAARRAPAERKVIRFVWHDEATGEEEPFSEMIVDGGDVRVIQLRWPEDEDDEKRARDVAPGRA